jgi:hypothetical protein
MLSPHEIPRNASRAQKRRPRDREKTKRAAKEAV